MSPGYRDHQHLPRHRSGSIRQRKIDVPGLDRLGRPFRILLVDDAPVNLAVGSRLLARMGCHVDPASTGDYAVAMFADGCAEARYDMVLVDLTMPGMNGLQTSRAIRKVEAQLPADHPYRGRPVPILIMSSYDPGDNLARFRKAGANDVLYKPFQPDAVRDVLARWVPVHA